jgi:hypothetical protein
MTATPRNSRRNGAFRPVFRFLVMIAESALFHGVSRDHRPVTPVTTLLEFAATYIPARFCADGRRDRTGYDSSRPVNDVVVHRASDVQSEGRGKRTLGFAAVKSDWTSSAGEQLATGTF